MNHCSVNKSFFFLVETMHTGRRIFYRLRGFGRPANKLTFVCGRDDDEAISASAVDKISVADYFAKKYRKLLYPHLPCIDAAKGADKKANWLPMEVVTVLIFIVFS